MINNFKEKFGNGDRTIICFGDWSQKRQMKYKEPTKGVGFRKLFKEAGYETYLVDEYNTSKKCSICHEDCVKCIKRENPRPWRKNEMRTVHGLLKCKNCKTLWNRDENSSNNIYIIGRTAINKQVRPDYLTHKKTSVLLDDNTESVTRSLNELLFITL